MQNDMFRIFLNTPRTTPSIALWYGAFRMDYRIKEYKYLLHHILNDLTKEIIEEQIEYNFPGLAKEAKTY